MKTSCGSWRKFFASNGVPQPHRASDEDSDSKNKDGTHKTSGRINSYGIVASFPT